jgi:hypothetical protein
MIKLESKIGKINKSEEKTYNFLSDFNNLKELIPEDKIRNWESTEDSCRFTVEGIGGASMQMVVKKPLQTFLDSLIEQLEKMKF